MTEQAKRLRRYVKEAARETDTPIARLSVRTEVHRLNPRKYGTNAREYGNAVAIIDLSLTDADRPLAFLAALRAKSPKYLSARVLYGHKGKIVIGAGH